MAVNEEVLHDAILVHHGQRMVCEGCIEQPGQLTPNALGRNGGEARCSVAQSTAKWSVDVPPCVVRWWAGRESIDAKHAQRILLKTLVGHAHRPESTCAQVAAAPVKIDELARFEIDGHGVDRQITASKVKRNVRHQFHAFGAVSYTHLTLPTICSV